MRKSGDADRSPVYLLDAGVCLFVVVCLLSTLFAEHPTAAWQAFPDVLRWALIYFLIGRIVSSPWRIRIAALLLMLLNLKLAQFAIRSYFAGRAYGRDEIFMATRGVGAGSTGFFGNAGDLGVAMCVVWPLAAMLFLGESKRMAKLIYLVSFVAISGAILLCGSRGAFVAAILTALIASARNLRRFGIAILFLILIPGLSYLLPAGSKTRLRSVEHWQQDRTATTRINLWRAGFKMFLDHPVLGVGLGDFPEEYAMHYAGPGEDPVEWAPHSIYVQTLSELGLAGAIPLLLILFSFWRLNARTLKSLSPPAKSEKRPLGSYLAHGLRLAMVGYLISGAFLTVLYYPHLWILLGLSVGAYTASARPELGTTQLEPEKQPGGLVLAIPGGGVSY